MGYHQVNPRRREAEHFQQTREDHGRAVIRHRQAERAFLPRRIEAPRPHNLPHQSQGFVQGRNNLKRLCARHEAPVSAYQQGVIEQMSQTPERVTDRWLAHVQSDGRAQHMPLDQQSVEDHQKVKVDAA
ncbi:hypothetical protein GCM10011505_46180 [Tistrella bauzanensis]|uniref:Uncharacterized protein n=1 Tax=Tistrella bauzanensis TaxID=657419 RepID=A0ABQ1J7Z5_9PROT|nr:hypothetical protein GCM10011505_46180 [Tistrella bauzanensis]